MKRYGLINEERTDVVTWYTLGITRWLTVPCKPPKLNPKAEDFLAAGCLLEEHPVIPSGKKEGEILIEQDKITYSVVPLSPVEIAEIEAEAERKDNIQKLKDIHTVYVDRLYWRGKTNDQIDEIINTLFNSADPVKIGQACRQAFKLLAKAERDDVALFDLLRDIGILPK